MIDVRRVIYPFIDPAIIPLINHLWKTMNTMNIGTTAIMIEAEYTPHGIGNLPPNPILDIARGRV